ncbi:GNAT superfamily N-acetyltransferase [Bacillus mesophilus]|uniref:GNAT family N-acetyltransferase n=1 Tax=Bacillus mesophilus TaxID=1808955 RepID=A0A6M0QAP8_9BACI|nr:GNAT family N-acetyltransferase [Bacillus mesophilus]MBM7662615.1 GNAT superfamily N-acetyltransferase [Bacillus mesophilus]NEY73317.1 GNAT family N-acetyltransferase [Bacillus mesophilus]
MLEREITINANLHTYKIRNYVENDAVEIGSFDFMAMLAYQYNGDYQAENIFCAQDEEGHILGAGHLVPDQTWLLLGKADQPADFIYKLNLDISINHNRPGSERVLEDLFISLVSRAKQLRAEHPTKKISISHTIESDDLEEIDFYLSKGFIVRRNHLIMKRDLTEPIPEQSLPKHIKIINWKMKTQEEEEQYLKAEEAADADGLSWSINTLRWTKAGAEWDTFTAFEGEKVIGSVMTWGLGADRSATESIFVLPEWRRKGVAKAVITEALKFLKKQGKTEATLGVFDENAGAISLYKALGYKMLSINIEFGLEI